MVNIKAKNSERVYPLDIEHAQKLLRWKPELYEVVDDKFELKEGELKRKPNKRKNQESDKQA